MKKLWIFAMVLLVILQMPLAAHHLSRGNGSAPDLVDNYAHGANSGGDIEAGMDNAGNMGDGVGNAETGMDSAGPGEPTDDGVNGAPDDVPGTAPEPGGPSDD